MKLWHHRPALRWDEGYPIGTGRIGAMVLGDPRRERLALNHEWLWDGRTRDRDVPDVAHRLGEVRELLLRGEYAEGTRLGNELFGAHGEPIPGKRNRVGPYLPAGDLLLEFSHDAIHGYARTLDLDAGVVTVHYSGEGVEMVRETMAHLEDDLIYGRVRVGTVGASGSFSARIGLDRRHHPDCELRYEVDPTRLILQGRGHGGMEFAARCRLWHEGPEPARQDGYRVAINHAAELRFVVNLGVSVRGREAYGELDERDPDPASLDWDALLASQREAVAAHIGSAKVAVAVPEAYAERVEADTESRVAAARRDDPDPALPLLYERFGRWMLMCSTLHGELPPNLQGIWNEEFRPAWDCDLHHNINLQMNYWPAEPAGMGYTVRPLIEHLERFVPHGREVARKLYGCGGTYLPLQSDPWGLATPESYGWAVWIGGAPWMAQHVWDHYQFQQDRDYLARRAYPYLKEVAAFFEDYLIEDEAGRLQVVPSQSPENRFVGGGDLPVSLCVSATSDVLLIRDLFHMAAEAAQTLGVDADKATQWRAMAAKLPEPGIGRHGQLMEWNQDFEEAEPHHRHLSHLIGVQPGGSVTPEATPELWRAAEVSLRRRLEAGGGHTGWSRAWTACLFARFGRAEEAWDHLLRLITDFATVSLLDLHPPFQIEGNFGGASAVHEMLVQSQAGVIRLLPALPGAWRQAGEATGFRARGGFVVDVAWREGRLTAATIEATRDAPCAVIPGETAIRVTRIEATGETPIEASVVEGRLMFETRAGERYRLVPARNV